LASRIENQQVEVRMRKLAMGLMLVVLVALSACATGGTGTASKATPADASTMPPVKASDNVEAEASVVPVRWVALSFQVGGLVAAVNAQEGDVVKAGDVLVQLDDANARLAVAQAEAALAQAEAQLAQAKAGARPAEIALAEQAVKAVEAAVAGATAQLAHLQSGGRAADIAAAEVALTQASTQEKGLQDNYDQLIKVIEKYGVGGGPPEEQLRAALETARLGTIAAQNRLAQVKAGATRSEIEVARADVAAAQAQQARAQAQLDLLKAGATPEDIAVAEAGVKQAQAGLAQAEAQLPKLRLVAPFDGTLASFDLKPGAFVSPGVPVLRLADLSAWQFETDDLTELNIVGVREGDPAVVTFDAIPALELSGKVMRIKALGENKRGDITYTVIVQPDQHDERLRWNMTASVSVEPNK
jgi:HlyD family secretion protein